ncbi:hypothetical protein CesoFtcFv8_001632 [Champsocephalus esox]|uniref:Uncharacterized protein n=1 Tax=Champsocephalus esox TaxID=159716 RepID=A0AAN8D3V2_9TELE|nr:hypothetical protein CesoFtcFv8_001632 [Champsocephalus esox]
MKLLKTSERVDVVWDTYITGSIKESTREKRGKGIQRKVPGQNKLPRNWPHFLRDPMNKPELFTFLSSKIASTAWPVGKQVFITSGVRVVGTDTSHFMLPCNHEEADTRIMIHLLDALEHGLVRTVDTDVVVILIGKFHTLLTKYPTADIWVAFGTGKSYTYHHINTICHTLGKDRLTALPVFHCFTGCDTTSAFCRKGKKSAWDAWNSYPEVTQAFNYMAANPHTRRDHRCRKLSTSRALHSRPLRQDK